MPSRLPPVLFDESQENLVLQVRGLLAHSIYIYTYICARLLACVVFCSLHSNFVALLRLFLLAYKDYMGHMRKLSQSCRTGSGVDVSNRMLDKWLVAQHWLFVHHDVMMRR